MTRSKVKTTINFAVVHACKHPVMTCCHLWFTVTGTCSCSTLASYPVSSSQFFNVARRKTGGEPGISAHVTYVPAYTYGKGTGRVQIARGQLTTWYGVERIPGVACPCFTPYHLVNCPRTIFTLPVPRICSHVSHVGRDTRLPSRLSACNIEKLGGGDWVRGYA